MSKTQPAVYSSHLSSTQSLVRGFCSSLFFPLLDVARVRSTAIGNGKSTCCGSKPKGTVHVYGHTSQDGPTFHDVSSTAAVGGPEEEMKTVGKR